MKTNTTHNTATCDYCAGPDATVTTDYGDTICVPCFIGKPTVFDLNDLLGTPDPILEDIAKKAYDTWCMALDANVSPELLEALHKASVAAMEASTASLTL